MREIIVAFSILEQIFATCNSVPFPKCRFRNFKNFSFLKAVNFDQSEKYRTMNHTIRRRSLFPVNHFSITAVKIHFHSLNICEFTFVFIRNY